MKISSQCLDVVGCSFQCSASKSLYTRQPYTLCLSPKKFTDDYLVVSTAKYILLCCPLV